MAQSSSGLHGKILIRLIVYLTATFIAVMIMASVVGMNLYVWLEEQQGNRQVKMPDYIQVNEVGDLGLGLTDEIDLAGATHRWCYLPVLSREVDWPLVLVSGGKIAARLLPVDRLGDDDRERSEILRRKAEKGAWISDDGLYVLDFEFMEIPINEAARADLEELLEVSSKWTRMKVVRDEGE